MTLQTPLLLMTLIGMGLRQCSCDSAYPWYRQALIEISKHMLLTNHFNVSREEFDTVLQMVRQLEKLQAGQTQLLSSNLGNISFAVWYPFLL